MSGEKKFTHQDMGQAFRAGEMYTMDDQAGRNPIEFPEWLDAYESVRDEEE